MKAEAKMSLWARGSICLALSLFYSDAVSAQGILYFTPEQPTYYSVGYPGTLDFNLDINRDGSTDFILRSNDPYSSVNNVVLIPLGNNAIVNMSSSVANMNPGDTVGLSLNPVYYWSSVKTPISAVAALPDPPYGVELGNFVGQSGGYFGFDFLETGSHHYGWLRISSPINDAAICADVVDWAYESTPNLPIAVGTVPEPSTLALSIIALMALVFRKRFR